LLYADDILLVSHSLHDLQAMLDLSVKEAADLDFTFNAKKSVVEEFTDYDSVVVFSAVGPVYNAKFFVISH